MSKNIDTKKTCEPLSGLLPEKWFFQYVENESAVILNANNKGYVTIDFIKRNFRSGWSFITGNNISKKKFSGNKWRERLIVEACKYLEEDLK